MIGVLSLDRKTSVDAIVGHLEEVDEVRALRTLLEVARAGCDLVVVVQPTVDGRRASRIVQAATDRRRRATPLVWIANTDDTTTLYHLSGLPIARILSMSLGPDILWHITIHLRAGETPRDPVLEVIRSRLGFEAALGRALGLAASCLPPFRSITDLGAAVKTGPSALRKQWSAATFGDLALKALLNRIQLSRLQQLLGWGYSIPKAVEVYGIRRTTADGIARRLLGTPLAEGVDDPVGSWKGIAELLDEHLLSA